MSLGRCAVVVTGGTDASQHNEEASAVVNALIDAGFRELGGARLTSLIGLRDAAQLTEARLRLRAGLRTNRNDVPGVLAAAVLAFFDAPDDYDVQAVGTRAQHEVLSLIPEGPRATSAAEGLLAARDSAAGLDLFNLLNEDAPSP